MNDVMFLRRSLAGDSTFEVQRLIKTTTTKTFAEVPYHLAAPAPREEPKGENDG